MPAIFHVKSNTIGDFTGTVTVMNSAGSTATANATDLVRPVDWNSGHRFAQTIAGNTAGQSTGIGTNLVFGGSNGITLNISTGADVNTLWISGNTAGGGAGLTATMWWPYNEGVNVAGQRGNASWAIAPVPTPPTAAGGVVSVDRLCFPIQLTNATNSTGTVTLSMSFGLYSRTASSLSLYGSTTGTLAITFSGTVNNSTNAGIRLMTIPWTTNIDDNRYYVAVASRTTTGGANATINQMLVSQINSNFSGLFGVNSNRSNQWPLGMGVYSASSTAFPGSIAFSQIDGTVSLAARPPSWFMVNGTA
jgi:hypothetical protein